MTKKAKTKTKSDEAPPKSVPAEKQTTEPSGGPGADQTAGGAPVPQPPTPAQVGAAAQPPIAVQPEAAKLHDSPNPAAFAPTPQPPDTKSGESKTQELLAAITQEPAQLGFVGSPAEKPPAAQSLFQLGVLGSPVQKPPTTQPPTQAGVVGSPAKKTPSTQPPTQSAVVSSPAEKSPAAQPPTQSGVMGSPAQKPPSAQSPTETGVVGSPVEKPASTQPPTQSAVVGSPAEKPPSTQPLTQSGVVGSPAEKPPSTQPLTQSGAVGSPAQKPPATQPLTQLGNIGSVGEKPPAPKQDNASNSEVKTSTLVKSEPPREQPTAPKPNSQPVPQPVSDASLSTTSSEKTIKVPLDKSRTDKDSKPIATAKAQDPGRDTDKNKKVSSASPNAAPNGQPTKQPAEKQNKRQEAKESIPPSSIQKRDPSTNKPSEIDSKQSSHETVIEKSDSSSKTKAAKDNTVAKVEDKVSTQVKDEPNNNQFAGATSETLVKQDKEPSKKKTDAEPPKPKVSNKNTAAVATENKKSAEKLETPKEVKTAEQKVDAAPATQGNQQKPPSPKSDPNGKVNKSTTPNKNKPKNEPSASKTEGTPKPKEGKQADKGGKKDTTAAASGAQPLPEVSAAATVSTATDSSKKSSSSILPDTVSKVPISDAVTPDHSAQAKEDDGKSKQQNKGDSKDGKEVPIKDDSQSKSSSKKKNRQQKKSVSEDVKPSQENDSKGPQEGGKSKNNEKKKPAPASPSTEKESSHATAPAPVEKNRKNAPGESVISEPKVSPGKSPTAEKTQVSITKNNSQITAEKDLPDKTQVTATESQPEDQEASKKKKRNRHKKKNKVGDGDNSTDTNVEEGKQQATNVTAVGGERKGKEKQQTTTPSTNKSKGQQKDSQPGQTNASKGAQPVPAASAKQASDTTAQTASAKKRNRRKKKGASGTEKDGDTILPQENKSAESKETLVAKPEEQKAKANTQPPQKTDEAHKKKNESKPSPKLEKPQQQDAPFSDGIEDQSENFVEVKSKNKRNKKKKLESVEAKEDAARLLSSSNNGSKVVAENNVDTRVSSSKSKSEGGESVNEATNKVAAPKISQEAREQKMLNKKLAERAQLKIQRQIESNALSEVEKSEKYLETITKNLRELTKLRSSKLEDVLLKPGEEEIDYEYTPVQRNTFLATTCHVCKESKPREIVRICEQCHLMSYCSEEHQKSDWPAHKDLCQAISEMCKERGTDNLYAPAVGLSAEEYRAYRMNALLECSAILNRQLEPYEQEIILYPNVCHTCHSPSSASLHTCESCSMVSYCSPDHRPPNHDVWCHDLQLYKSLIIFQSRNGVISPQLPVLLPESYQPPSGDMHSDLRTLSGGVDASPLERAVLSEIATGPLTALFALHKSNKVSGTTEKLVIHFVGAEWSFEMERADKWEAFLLHLIPSLKALVLVFVGPEVCSLPPEARGLLEKQSRLCPQCQEKGRIVQMVIPPQNFYHEYVASQDFIPPTMICAYNAGLYRPNGHKDVDSWSDTVAALLRDPGVPVAVTSYTAEEVLKDAERLQQHKALNFVLPPSQNPYRSLRPNRNFASDDVTPVIFKNYYITIATSATP